MFEPQLDKSIEVYIDDMVVKSMVVSEHVIDLGNIFEILRKHRFKCFQVLVWCRIRQVPGIHGDSQGY